MKKGILKEDTIKMVKEKAVETSKQKKHTMNILQALIDGKKVKNKNIDMEYKLSKTGVLLFKLDKGRWEKSAIYFNDILTKSFCIKGVK